MATSRIYRSRMFRQCSAAQGRIDLNWNRLIFRYTEPADRLRLVEMQTRFNSVTSEYAAVPKKLDDINFDQWRKEISTPGIVDGLEKKFNAEMAKEVKLDAGERASIESAQSAEVRATEEKAGTSGAFLEELKAEIEWTTNWYAKPEQIPIGSKRGWNQFAQNTMLPAMQIHRMNRYMFLSDTWRAHGRPIHQIHKIDLSALREHLQKGNIAALQPVAPIMEATGSLWFAHRPFFKKWIKAVPYPAMFKDPNVSIHYRAHKLRQLR